MGDIVPGSAKCRLRSVAWFAFKCSVTWQVKRKKKKKKILSNLLGNSRYGGGKDRDRKPFVFPYLTHG